MEADRTTRRLLERLRRLEERMERDAERMRADMRSRQATVEAVLESTRKQVAGVRQEVSRQLERLEGSLDRQGSHLADWLLDVESRIDEMQTGRIEDLREVQAVLEEHLAQADSQRESLEERVRRLEEKDRPPAA